MLGGGCHSAVSLKQGLGNRERVGTGRTHPFSHETASFGLLIELCDVWGRFDLDPEL